MAIIRVQVYFRNLWTADIALPTSRKASSSSSGDKPHTPQMPQKASSLRPRLAKVVQNVPESVTQDPLPTYIGREGEEAREREGGAQEKDWEALHSGQVFFYTKNNK